MPAFSLELQTLAARLARDGAARLIADAEREGLLGLVTATGATLAPELAAARRRLELEDALRTQELAQVTAALASAGVRPVIFKGAALAYTHYAAPWHRPRADIDVLVPHAHRERAGRALAAAGYVPGDLVRGRLVMRQDLWERRLTPGAIQMVDVHVEVSNRAFFAAQLPSEALLARAQAAPPAAGAWHLDPVDALIVSAVHHVAHHADGRRLIWTCDVHRQAAALDEAATAVLLARARACGLASIVAHELDGAVTAFGDGPGALAREVIDALAEAGEQEDARAFLTGGRGRAGDLWLDLCALPRWRDRAALIREHVMPPASFMARAERGPQRGPLGWQYLRRLVVGGARFVRRPR